MPIESSGPRQVEINGFLLKKRVKGDLKTSM